MSFMIEGKKLLGKFESNQNKISNITGTFFDKEPVYVGKYLHTNLKLYGGKTKTDFHDRKPPKKDSPCFCLLVIVLDSAYKTKNEVDKYFPQIFLEESEYNRAGETGETFQSKGGMKH